MVKFAGHSILIAKIKFLNKLALTDELLMSRCLDLAKSGFPAVLPNPMVGALIVSEARIIAEGYHHYFGGIHAEVDAIRKVKDKEILRKSTLYVNLEPCSHFGKTPPCVHQIIEAGIPEVVVAGKDPNPLVNGRGINILKEHGIVVREGVRETEAIELNKRFYTFYRKNRPYIILKFATTKDGFLAKENYYSKWISNEYSRILVHKWRGEEMAILTGANTVRYDDPHLTNRFSKTGNPVRIFFDRDLSIPVTKHIFDNSSRTIVYNFVKEDKDNQTEWVKLDRTKDFIAQIINHLFTINIQSLIVEGGAKILSAFLDRNLWDEARIFTAEKLFRSGIKAPEIRVDPFETIEIIDNQLNIYFNSGQGLKKPDKA